MRVGAVATLGRNLDKRDPDVRVESFSIHRPRAVTSLPQRVSVSLGLKICNSSMERLTGTFLLSEDQRKLVTKNDWKWETTNGKK